MKNWTDYDTFLMHLECTIENIGVNAIKHQDQEQVHKEAMKAVEFILATIERQKGREEKTIKTGKQHEPTNDVETKPCNIYSVVCCAFLTEAQTPKIELKQLFFRHCIRFRYGVGFFTD